MATQELASLGIGNRLSQNIKMFLSLTKPTIGVLVAITALPTLLAGQDQLVSPYLIVFTLLGTLLLAGSGAVFNSLIDRDLDVSMGRTSSRPTVTGMISVREGIVFASLLGIIGFAILCLVLTLWLPPLV